MIGEFCGILKETMKQKSLILYLYRHRIFPVAVGMLLLWGGVFLPLSVLAEESIDQEALEAEKKAKEEEEKKEKERKEAEKKAEKIEDKLEKEKDKLGDLSQDLQQINGSLSVTQKAIATTKQHIIRTEDTIERKEGEIERLEGLLEEQKRALQGMLQSLYDASQTPIVEVVFREGNASRVLNEKDGISALERRITMLIEESKNTKDKIEKERAELDAVKQEKERILAQHSVAQQALLTDKQETQSDIAEKEATIEELQKKLAELQSDINALTGKSYNAKDIREAVEYASGKTGVPKGVLYGFLKMETNLGANTGQCTYKEVEKVAVARYKKYGSKYKKSIDLLYKRRDLFYDLVKDLGYSKDKKVSCSPSGYIGQGGAMGVSQFMSDVWMGYVPEIRAKTGRKTPDPWNLTDGVMAMALKLRKAGATSDSSSAIRTAARSYLGTDHKPYYEGIIYWAKNYKKLFN